VSTPARYLPALLKRWRLADRFQVAKNLSEAVQQLLAGVLLEMKTASQGAEAATGARGESLLPIEEWRPAQEESVKQIIATRRAERQGRYQRVLALCEQGLTSQEIAGRLGMKARPVREWLHKGVAPESRPRRKYHSEFDPYASYGLKRGPRRRAPWPPTLAGSKVPGIERL